MITTPLVSDLQFVKLQLSTKNSFGRALRIVPQSVVFALSNKQFLEKMHALSAFLKKKIIQYIPSKKQQKKRYTRA
jgi:hypothetical protein